MRRSLVRRITPHLVLGAFATSALAPLTLVFLNAVKPNFEVLVNPLALPKRWTFENFATAWNYGHFAVGFQNSLRVTITAVLVVLLFAAPAGYVLGGNRVKAQPAITIYFTMAMTVPAQLFIFPLYALMARIHLLDNPYAVGVVIAAINLPFSTFLMRTFFLAVPASLEEAALVDGAGTLQLFARVLLPIVRPGLITAGVLVAFNAWNDFLISNTFLHSADVKTATLGFLTMNGTFSTELGAMMAGAVILIVPSMVVFMVLQRYVAEGLASGAVKG